MSYDIVGDVHGHADRLEQLLLRLGYRHRSGAWRHPTRNAIFVGDLIDRGPGQIRTLELVRDMVEAGSARACMGNHEFNAIAFATPDPSTGGDFLRPRSGATGRKNHHQHQAFLAEVGQDSAEHAAWIEWFMDLPLWIEEPAFRVVHACWNPSATKVLLERLEPEGKLTPVMVAAASQPGNPVGHAVEVLLKGEEVNLPRGRTFTDKDGHTRTAIRTRWWDPRLTSYCSAYIGPPGVDIPDAPILGYNPLPPPDRPTFIGHYWLDGEDGFAPLTPRVACVDYSVAKGGPLVAYRFDGEAELSPRKFIGV